VFPLHDDNPRLSWPIVTALLIALNVLSWAFLQGFGTERALAGSLCRYGLIPADLLGVAAPGLQIPLGPTLVCVIDGQSGWLSLLSSMFMHGGWMHIIGNMWFLWVFGDNVEDLMGPFRYLAFYLLCGLAAAAAQVLSDPGSVIPMVGASGAIGGVMGAYARLHPHARVQALLVLGIYFTRIWVPAWVMLGYWFLLQLMGALPALESRTGGVAFWAHIGGFVAGLGLSFVLVDRRRVEQHRLRRVCGAASRGAGW
jgi:membrane associated rhomboid family serine protease